MRNNTRIWNLLNLELLLYDYKFLALLVSLRDLAKFAYQIISRDQKMSLWGEMSIHIETYAKAENVTEQRFQ